MYKKIILFIVLGWCYIMAFGQAQRTKRICDTIPYECILQKIVIPIEVNGMKVKYILDTGGRTGTMWEEAMDMGVKSAGSSVHISDLNDEKAMYQEGILSNVKLGPNYILQQLKTMVLPEVGMFKELGVVGILGGDAFAQSVLTFDSQKKIIIINYPYRPLGLKIQDGVEMFPGTTNHSILNVNVGGVEKKMLFDSGAHGFLLISTDDFLEFEKLGVCTRIATGYGINGIGLLGLTEPTDIMKGVIPELNFLGKKFTNIGCMTSPNSLSIIGVDIIKYGKVIIDYMRKRFYFFPFEEAVEDMGGSLKNWNVGVLPSNDRFEITSIWESIKGQVNFGDEVININGKELQGLPMSQPIIDSIFNKIIGEQAFIIIKQDGREKRVEIRKE